MLFVVVGIEMEFMNGVFLDEVSGLNSSLLKLKLFFSLVFYPRFYVLQNVLLMNRLEFSCFAYILWN